MARNPAYITLKDHKENFNINPKCRLINPAKSELGKVAKLIVENIKKKVTLQPMENQLVPKYFRKRESYIYSN